MSKESQFVGSGERARNRCLALLLFAALMALHQLFQTASQLGSFLFASPDFQGQTGLNKSINNLTLLGVYGQGRIGVNQSINNLTLLGVYDKEDSKDTVIQELKAGIASLTEELKANAHLEVSHDSTPFASKNKKRSAGRSRDSTPFASKKEKRSAGNSRDSTPITSKKEKRSAERSSGETSVVKVKTIEKSNLTESRSSRLNIQDPMDIPRGNRSEPSGRGSSVLMLKNFYWKREVLSSDTNILFVHVGKTGGSSLRKKLMVNCYFSQSKPRADMQKCHENMVDTQLSQHSMALMHGDLIGGAASDLSQINAFLFCVRDPVDRFISWFYHAMNELKSKYVTPWIKNFYRCFPTIVSVARTLQNESTSVKTLCGPTLVELLHGKGPPRTSHMFHNPMYYTMKTALKYPANKIYVIRTSNVWSDFNTIDVMLGGHGNLSTVQNKVDHNSTRHAVKDSTVPSQMIPKLCCALVEEIDTYRYLLHRAVNPVHVMQMLNETYTMCNTSSLEDLVDTCPNFLLPTNYRI